MPRTRRAQKMKETFIVALAGICCGIFVSFYLREEDPTFEIPIRSKLILRAMSDIKSTPVPSVQQPRILCWVVTQPSNHRKKAIHVLGTWGRRCDRLLFMSTWNDSSLPGVVPLPVREGRDHLWSKTKSALSYLREHHLDDADWFFKADDDTYAILENMRHLLLPLDANLPFHLGCRFRPFHPQGYMSGGAGYILSRAALKEVVDVGFHSKDLCPQDDALHEDVALGQCAESVGVILLDTRDDNGALRFHPYSPELHANPSSMNQTDKEWLAKYAWTPIKPGMDCCSPQAVTFHYIKPEDMYLFEFLVYKLKPYGVKHALKRNRKRKGFNRKRI